MFGDADALIQIDMSEYIEKFTGSRLTVRLLAMLATKKAVSFPKRSEDAPTLLYFFDETEKAHPDVMHLLLQILEEGKITDSLGQKIDFRNTIIIMTSNVGAELINAKRRWALARSPATDRTRRCATRF